MSHKVKIPNLKELKSRFRAGGCTVTDLDETAFEFAQSDFPVRTHVFVNPCYVQFSTFIFAKPVGSRTNSENRIYEFLSNLNLKAKLVKFTLEADRREMKKGAWPIWISAKLVTGVAGGDYDGAALQNLVELWFQDLAEIDSFRGFKVFYMMPDE